MILLNTKVLSEFMRPRPSARVAAWLDEQPAQTSAPAPSAVPRSNWGSR